MNPKRLKVTYSTTECEYNNNQRSVLRGCFMAVKGGMARRKMDIELACLVPPETLNPKP